MFLIFILSLRYYFKDLKEIPAMEIDPVDDWLIKTNARRYVLGGASALAVVAVVFALLSMPGLKKTEGQEAETESELTAEATESASSSSDESSASVETNEVTEGETLAAAPEAETPAAPNEKEEAAPATVQAPANGFIKGIHVLGQKAFADDTQGCYLFLLVRHQDCPPEGNSRTILQGK